MGMFLDEARNGKFTASQIHGLMYEKTDKRGFETLCYEKAYERLGIAKPEGYTGDATVHGNENEPMAIMTFEMVTGKTVIKTGSESTFIEFFNGGCTPDGKINEGPEGVEVKCPFNPAIFLKQFMLKNQEELKKYNKTYYWQVQSSLLFTDWELWHWVSYHPEIYTKYRKIGIMQIEPNLDDHKLIVDRLQEAEEFVGQIIKKIVS